MSVHPPLEMLMIEQRAFREQSGDEKARMGFEESLQRIRDAGLKRHLRVSEFIELKCAQSTNTLSGKLLRVYEDMQQGGVYSSEWLGGALRRKGTKLFVYVDPVGLEWNGSMYVVRRELVASGIRLFDVGEKQGFEHYPVGEFSDEFLEFFLGRSQKELPQDLRKGDGRLQIFVPPEGVWWPLNTDAFTCGYGVLGDYASAASRGVRDLKS